MCAAAADGKIHIFDCGPDGTCYDGDDFEIGTAMKDANGGFTAFFSIVLKPGQKLYAIDACFDPLRGGPVVVVSAPTVAPTLSRDLLVVLAVLLSGVGLLSLRHMHRSA